MRFRPCIDIHDGKVKQIVGGSLDDRTGADTNFVSDQGASFYGRLYRSCNLPGGHIILLNKADTAEYREDIREASEALSEFPGGFMIGGGVNADNAEDYIKLGASHVIVTSFVFRDGVIDFERLKDLTNVIGSEHLVLDLSCRRAPLGLEGHTEDTFYIVTDRWQKFTDVELNHETLDMLSEYCAEFLIHAVDVEKKKSGIDKELISILGSWNGENPITYAGGVSTFEDLEIIRTLGHNRVDVTIGSALSIFGGDMDFIKVIDFMKE